MVNLRLHWKHLATMVTLLSWFGVANSQDQALTEETVLPPTRFSTNELIPLFIPGPSQLQFGVDASTILVGDDQIVRYVLVAKSDQGAMNVWFEGIHCKAAAVKVLARWNPRNEQWTAVTAGIWNPLSGSSRGTRHALLLAQGGMCDATTPNRPMSKMLRELKTGKTDASNR